MHGLVFGDGSWNKQEIRSGEHLHYVQLYGERMAAFRDFFDQVNFSSCLDVHPGYVGTGVVRACVNLKHLLPETADAEYIAGFVDGWLAADGDPVKAGSWRIRSTDHEALAWLERAAPIAGYVAVGSGEESNMVTNFGPRNRSIRWLYLATRESYWRVMSVAPAEADDADTFCAVVPGKHEFALAGGIYQPELRGVRTGVPRGGDLPGGRASRQVERVRRDQLRLPGSRQDQPARRQVRARERRPQRTDRLGRGSGAGIAQTGRRYAQRRLSPGSGEGAIFATR